mmetsp:Transcript_1363/g.3512  ORF Transcript_1363/g.3512 Transcript_1363/m.3512 type:complete len:414 (+) Transcript_1363:44-1285(+)
MALCTIVTAVVATNFCFAGKGNACCSPNGMTPDRVSVPGLTRPGFADVPRLCEGLCVAIPGCEAFSHSASHRQCILCARCEGRQSTHLGSYSNWKVVHPNSTIVKHVMLHDAPKALTISNHKHPHDEQPCLSPRPCTVPARAVALLFRGETYRWGCDELGASKQRTVMQAYMKMLVKPLEELGFCVHIFLVFDRGCPDLERETVAICGDRVALTHRVHTNSQPENVRAVMDQFLATQHANKYDFVVLARFDVQLLTPFYTWGCSTLDPRRLSVAAKCDPRMWKAFNCTSDLLYIIPRNLFIMFASQLGRRVSVSEGGIERCCFNMRCLGNGGHGCLNLLSSHLQEEGVNFCWPQAVHKVSEWNPNYMVPQCNDLPKGKAGSVWRCRLPELQGRAYNRTTGDLSVPLQKRGRRP